MQHSCEQCKRVSCKKREIGRLVSNCKQYLEKPYCFADKIRASDNEFMAEALSAICDLSKDDMLKCLNKEIDED